MKKSQKGFTLVELIVVIAIIGVLAAILVPAMMGYIKDSKFTSANANAKTIYNAISAFSQKCETAGKPLANADNTKTGVLTVAAAGNNAKVSNIGAIAAAGQLAAGATAEIQLAVNNSLGSEAAGSKYVIIFNKKGFPTATYWAKTTSDEIVGKYPAPEDNEETANGISTLAGNAGNGNT